MIRPLRRLTRGRHQAPAGGDVAPPPVLDQAQIGMIRSLEEDDGRGSEDLFRTFTVEAHEEAQRIVEAVAAGDAPAVAHGAHSLRGAAAMFGLPRLAATASRLEQAGRMQDLKAAAALLCDLEGDLADGVAALAAKSAGDAPP